MQISGKITHVLPERSGVSQRSGTEWRCGSYVVETLEQYPKKCNFEVFGTDKIQQFNIQVGQLLTLILTSTHTSITAVGSTAYALGV